MSNESLERPPVAPIVGVVVAGIVGVFVLRWLLRAIIGGITFLILCAAIVAVAYGVSRLRSSGDE